MAFLRRVFLYSDGGWACPQRIQDTAVEVLLGSTTKLISQSLSLPIPLLTFMHWPNISTDTNSMNMHSSLLHPFDLDSHLGVVVVVVVLFFFWGGRLSHLHFPYCKGLARGMESLEHVGIYNAR